MIKVSILFTYVRRKRQVIHFSFIAQLKAENAKIQYLNLQAVLKVGFMAGYPFQKDIICSGNNAESTFI